MKWNIGNQQFKSKDECRKFVRNILIGLGPCEVTKDHINYNFLVDMTKKHPQSLNKIGSGIDCFIVCKDRLNGDAYSLNIKRVDGSIIDISWNICCGYIKAQDLTEAMRASVSQQVIDFRAQKTGICDGCKKTSNKLDVHHHSVDFNTIKREFIEKTKCEIPSKFDDDEYNRPILKDSQFKSDWLEYHQFRAKYRLLCCDCHHKSHGSKKINKPQGCCL